MDFDVSPPESAGLFRPLVGDISNLLCALSSCSPPALLAEAVLALALSAGGSAACPVAGLCLAIAGPAVGKLGADSPVAEYHSSVTISASSIKGALMTSSPKLGSIGSDLIMFPVLKSLVTLHQALSQLGPSGIVPLRYLAFLSRRANTLKP